MLEENKMERRIISTKEFAGISASTIEQFGVANADRMLLRIDQIGESTSTARGTQKEMTIQYGLDIFPTKLPSKINQDKPILTYNFPKFTRTLDREDREGQEIQEDLASIYRELIFESIQDDDLSLDGTKSRNAIGVVVTMGKSDPRALQLPKRKTLSNILEIFRAQDVDEAIHEAQLTQNPKHLIERILPVYLPKVPRELIAGSIAYFNEQP